MLLVLHSTLTFFQRGRENREGAAVAMRDTRAAADRRHLPGRSTCAQASGESTRGYPKLPGLSVSYRSSRR